MKKISILFAGAAMFASTFALAGESENLIANGNAADGLKNWNNVKKVADDGPDGAKCFEVTGHTHAISQELIEVDAQSKYILSGMLKSGNEKPNKVYVGLALFDKNKRGIDSTSVSVLPKSETVLAADAKKGAKVITVKEAPGWDALLKAKRLMVVFDVDNSGKYNDLPNFNYYEVKGLESKDDGVEVMLGKALAKDFAAGTNLRAHSKSGQLMYAFTANKNFGDWTKFSGTIKPEIKYGAPGSTFWPNTKYVKAFILANWGQKDGEVLKFTNLSLEKVEK